MSGYGNLCWPLSCILWNITQLNIGLIWRLGEMMSTYHFCLWYLTLSGLKCNRWNQHQQIYLLPTPMKKTVFGPRPETQAADFDFEAEVQHLPFKLNLREEVKLTCFQQSQFIDLIYDHPEVFSLHDEDLGFCNQIKHTIPTMMDRPVYLPHHTIPPQLQGEVYKCLDTWL